MNIENKSFEFLLTNATKKRMTIALEPWGETRKIEVGASVRVNVESPSTDPSQTLELKVDDKGRLAHLCPFEFFAGSINTEAAPSLRGLRLLRNSNLSVENHML